MWSSGPDSALYLGWRNVVKDNVNSPLVTLIHHTVLLLVVDFVDVSDGHFSWAPINHEPNPWVAINRNMDAVSVVKRRVLVCVGLDNATRFESCRHSPNNGAAGGVMVLQNFVHQRYCFFCEQIPALIL